MSSPGRPASASVAIVWCAAVLVVVILSAAPPVAGAPGLPRDDLRGPLDGSVRVLTPFDLPPQPWLPGHRGVDLAASPLAEVVAPADGTVAFAGPVAGRPVLSLDHGDGLRTTYEPVRAVVTEGDRVRAGQPVGYVLAGHPTCPGEVCLHWGARVALGPGGGDDDYVDPVALLGFDVRPIRLKPLLPGDADR